MNEAEDHSPAPGSSTPLDVSDADLLRAFIDSGDDLAFGRLVARHAAGVRRVALLETGNAEAAEDVTQATFIVLSRRPRPALRSAKRKTNAEAWLHQVARYASANWRRAESRRRRREKAAAVPDRAGAPDPSQPSDLAEAVAAALRRLRRRDRRLILLRHVEEKPWSEVALAVSMSPEAARKATERASERLRAALQEQGIIAAPSAVAAGLHAIGAPASTATAAFVPVSSATISVSELAKGTIAMMNLKNAASVAMLATAIIFGGAGAVAIAQDHETSDPGARVVANSAALEGRLSDGTVVRLKAVSDGSGVWWDPDGSNPVVRTSAFLDQQMHFERQMNEFARRGGRPEQALRPKVGLEFELATNREALGDIQVFSDSGSREALLPSRRAAGECHLVIDLFDGQLTTVEFAVPAGEPISEDDVQLYGLEVQVCELDGKRVGLAPLYRTRLGNDDVTGATVMYAGDLTGRAIHAAIVLEDGTRLLGHVTSRSRAENVHVLNFYFSHDEIPQPARGRLVLSLVRLEMVRFSGFATTHGEKADPKVEVLSHEEYVSLLEAQACPVPGEQASGDEAVAQ